MRTAPTSSTKLAAPHAALPALSRCTGSGRSSTHRRHEDGLADDDWDGWQLLTKELGERVRLVGDHLFVTTQPSLRVASTNMSPTPFLSKSTKEDTTIADLAGAPDAGQIKTDSVCRGECMMKYNQRLWIRKNSERASYPGMKAFATRR